MNQSSNYTKIDVSPKDLFGKTPEPENVLPDVPFHLANLDGFIQTLEFVPTYKPSRVIDQVVLVTSGGSTRAYFYDTKPSALGWKYTTLT